MADEPRRLRLNNLQDVRLLDDMLSEAMTIMAAKTVEAEAWSRLMKVSKGLHAERVDMDRMMSDIPMTQNA